MEKHTPTTVQVESLFRMRVMLEIAYTMLWRKFIYFIQQETTITTTTTTNSAHGGSISGITYDGSADSIDVKVKVLSFLNVDITLNHQSLRGVKTLTYVGNNVNAAPAGTYKGSKSVLGQSVDATVTVVDSTHMNLEIEGTYSLSIT